MPISFHRMLSPIFNEPLLVVTCLHSLPLYLSCLYYQGLHHLYQLQPQMILHCGLSCKYSPLAVCTPSPTKRYLLICDKASITRDSAFTPMTSVSPKPNCRSYRDSQYINPSVPCFAVTAHTLCPSNLSISGNCFRFS